MQPSTDVTVFLAGYDYSSWYGTDQSGMQSFHFFRK